MHSNVLNLSALFHMFSSFVNSLEVEFFVQTFGLLVIWLEK